ncbi:hypothetical protein JL722_9397 [Aureococcus anophagefferens]|nr:hypothetical protein JL722_9397 [Aureococcus anophagefferens]
MEAQAVARQAFEAAYLAAAPLCEDQRALKRALREAAAALLAKLEAAQATKEAQTPPAEPSAPDEEARWAARVCKAVVKDMRHSEFCVAWSRRGGRSTTTFARRYRDFEALWKALRSGRLVAFQPLVVPLLPTKVGFGRHVEQSFVAAREAGLRRWLGVVTASPAARAAPCLARFLDPRTGPGTFAHDEAARSPDDDAFEETGAERPPPGGRQRAFSRLLSEKAALDGAAHAYRRASDATKALRARVAAARRPTRARAGAGGAAGALAPRRRAAPAREPGFIPDMPDLSPIKERPAPRREAPPPPKPAPPKPAPRGAADDGDYPTWRTDHAQSWRRQSAASSPPPPPAPAAASPGNGQRALARWANRRALADLLADLPALVPGAPAPGERPDAHGVRGAYLRAARFLHPDKQKNLSPDARDVANECFLLLKDKYERHATALAARERRV